MGANGESGGTTVLDDDFAEFSARVRGAWKRSATFTLSAVVTSLVMLMVSTMAVGVTRYVVVPRGPASLTTDLAFDYTSTAPTARASFAAVKFANVEPGEGARILSPKQTFDVEVELVVPESEYNVNVGMFQVNAKLLTSTGQKLLERSRPGMVTYTSREVRWLKMLTRAPLHAMGMIDERQSVRVAVIENYKEDAASPFTSIEVTMKPHAGSEKLPQIYEARATIHLSMSRFASALYFYPIASSLILIGALWSSSSAVALVCLLFYVLINGSNMYETKTQPPVTLNQKLKHAGAIADAIDSMDSTLSAHAPEQVNATSILDHGLRHRGNPNGSTS